MVVFTQGLEVRPFSTAFRASSAAPNITWGLDVLVHEVIAAITTAPWSTTNSPSSSDFTVTGLLTRPLACFVVVSVAIAQRPRVAGRERLVHRLVKLRVVLLVRVVTDVVGDLLAERGFGVRQRDSILRPLGSGDRRHHVGQVELEVLGELRLVLGVVPQALLFGVSLDQRELLFAAPGES